MTFNSVIEILITTKKDISLTSLKRLQSLTSSPITIIENSGKRAEKRIFKVSFKKKSKRQFTLIITVEGGFPIKRFVINDNVEPGLSQILETNCRCEEFDILEVKMITNRNNFV